MTTARKLPAISRGMFLLFATPNATPVSSREQHRVTWVLLKKKTPNAEHPTSNEELVFADGREGVVEDVVGHVAALGDSLGFVERPVDAEINPALAVFFFRLGEVGEAARHVGTHVAGVVFGHAVEFVGDNGERDT